ncbi:UNVERIFIED_CONTAM: B3 domain-containing transcription repressor VAL1 [Sesamum latifolium]|uniref:B3 domain-containing transcription repressor VAL1 n=1 Tax=Sesamum latifolium TaxID=2727402 RepID=A0AAW2XYP6_9LAMI
MDRFSGAGRHPVAWSKGKAWGVAPSVSFLSIKKLMEPKQSILGLRVCQTLPVSCHKNYVVDSKKRKISDNKVPREGEPSGLDALATAAVLGDNISDIAESSVGATTRHPRHRPGCTCIVCIQPPSGKGKHEPMCKCNVCLTVRRRFKTLMMHNETNQNGNQTDLEETNKGQLDLNCDPHREDDILAEAAGMSLTTLMNAATLPLDMYLGQNGVPVAGPCLISRTAGENEENAADEGFASGRADQENNREDG